MSKMTPLNLWTVLSLCLLMVAMPMRAADEVGADSAAQLRSLESAQANESRKLDKVAGEIAWLLEDLASNGLLDQAGGEQVEAFKTTIADVAEGRLPTAAQHLRNARLEADLAHVHLKSAGQEVDKILSQLAKVLAGSSTLLVQEELVTELKDIIKVQAELRAQTADWGKAMLISPDTAGAGKGPLMQDQADIRARLQTFVEKLEKARADALDESARSRFNQAAQLLTPTKTQSEVLADVLVTDPSVTDVLKAAVQQIENSDVLYAVDAQDRAIVTLKAALQILSAGQSELADFISGLEKLLEKQRALRKDVPDQETLESNAAIYEARQIEILDEVTNYTFDAPDLFVSKEGEFLVEPLLTALSQAVVAINAAEKNDALAAQDKAIALLESVYGTASEALEEKEGGDPFWADSPAVPEEFWKLPKDGDEEDLAMVDEDFPEIFDGVTFAELMIQPDSAAEGAAPDVTTAAAANRFVNFDEDAESEDPDFITDEGPPSVGQKEAPSAPGGNGVGNTSEVEQDRLADESLQRRRQRAKIQEYVRQLPPEFRQKVADYYELIAE